jgi:ATP-dependent RNA helicase DeaD
MNEKKNDYFEEFLRNEILHFDADNMQAAQESSDVKTEDSEKGKPAVNEKVESRKKEAMLARVADVLGDADGSKKTAAESETKADAADDDENQGEEYGSTDLDPRILRAIDEMGYKYMTPIQEAAIPVFLTGCDVIGQAQTGTGKTAAFGLPILQKVDPEKRCLQALILCPTRELAMQAAEELHKFSKYMHGVKILAVYGGQDIGRQIRNLHDGVQIVVGTPGRVMDHIRRNTMKMENVSTVVLDEADEMLDMGFRDDIETILKSVAEPRQVALFSATMPDPILEITKKYQHDARFIKMTSKEVTIDTIEQMYYRVQRGQKKEVLCRLMDYYDPQKALIFCNTKHMADELNTELKARGYDVDALHGDLSQNQRDNVMNAFRNGTIKVLIATDVAARGIDVSNVEEVYNYDVPDDLDYYVHRIGRTGRAGKTGRSLTLVAGRDSGKIREIERMFHTTVKEMQIPSAEDITAHKADKILKGAEDVAGTGSIDKMLPLLEKRAAESGLTMEQYAAAFLRQAMGEDLKDIVFESGRDRSYGDRGGRGRRGSSYGDRSGHMRSGSDRNSHGSGRTGGSRSHSGSGTRSSYGSDEKRRTEASGSRGRHPEDRERDSWDLTARDEQKPERGNSTGRAPRRKEGREYAAADGTERRFSHDHAGAPKTRKKDARGEVKSEKGKSYEPKKIRDVGLNGEPAAKRHSSFKGGSGAKGKGHGQGRSGGPDEPAFRLGRLTGLQIKTR